MEVYAPFQIHYDYPGAACSGSWQELVNVSGNTLVAGGHRVVWLDNSTNAVVLKNDFSAAAYHALAYRGTNGAVQNITAAGNVLNQGAGTHLRLRPQEAGSYFMLRNSYKSGSTNLNPFVGPVGSPAHFVH